MGIIACLFSLCLIITACGSGAGTTTSTDPAKTGSSETSPSPDVLALFSAEVQDCSSPPSNSVYLCKNNGMSTEDIIAVDVHLKSDAPVFGAAFDLLLDQSSVDVARKEDQTVDFSPPNPSQAGTQMWKHLFVALNEDRLIIGASRGKELGALTGDIKVVTLKFKIPTGESPINFSNNSIIDETGLPLIIHEDKWYGGYFTRK